MLPYYFLSKYLTEPIFGAKTTARVIFGAKPENVEVGSRINKDIES